MTPDLHVVLGATGGVGAAVVRELAGRGHAVRAVSRSGRSDVPGALATAADIADPDGLAAALTGATVVYHAAQPPYTEWPARFPAMTDAILTATADVGARLVMVDNLYLYGATDGGYGLDTPAGPMTEQTAAAATGRKGRVRAAMARTLLDADRAGRARVAIGRLGDYYGPGGTKSLVGEALFASALADRAVVWPGPGDHLHSFAYLPDVARALVTLGTDERADGRVWHLPHAAPMTPAAFVDLVQDRAGSRRRRRSIPAWMVGLAGRVNPMARELAELRYQLDRPFVVDHSAFDATFGPFAVTPHEVAVDETLHWFTNRAGSPGGVSSPDTHTLT